MRGDRIGPADKLYVTPPAVIAEVKAIIAKGAK